MIRKKEITNAENFQKYLYDWNRVNEKAYKDCNKIGKNNCLQVRYEDLVLQPEITIRKIIKFLNLKWTDKFLNHQDYIGKEIDVNKMGWSTHQIVKPINSESINSWIGKIKNFNPEQIRFIEPMLNKFNYIFDVTNMNFTIDKLVVDNNKNIKENRDYWIQKGRNFSEYIKLFD
jgi:hypothetical protein